jgi:hypothetical protein
VAHGQVAEERWWKWKVTTLGPDDHVSFHMALGEADWTIWKYYVSTIIQGTTRPSSNAGWTRKTKSMLPRAQLGEHFAFISSFSPSRPRHHSYSPHHQLNPLDYLYSLTVSSDHGY